MEAAGEEDQEGLSIHSPGQAPPSSASSLPKVELELRVLEALEMYPLSRLHGIHRHFVLYGLMEYLRRSFDRQFSAEEVLRLLDRFYNLEMLVREKSFSVYGLFYFILHIYLYMWLKNYVKSI
ncbi:hypothetical protein Cni_G16498 [Canna indica]|uniref:Uncharacterized protein n=1 Tax=Canna indica TaxID=4628 RepID=A0AAQ3KL29_9LILI|nr:hypothetical protein Cni_G16498 [Canna indica]